MSHDLGFHALPEWLEQMISPGLVVHVRPQLNIKGGWYTVVSRGPSTIRLRPRKGDIVMISLEQFGGALDIPQGIEFSPEEGVLHLLGYRVGKGGLSTRERRKVLEIVYKVPLASLPRVTNWQEWGEARSSTRLGKMQRCLLTFAEQSLRRRAPLLDAVEAWHADARWVTETFSPLPSR